ncbi:hypothetical protein SCALM49S_04976 [Streptomyces californicus]
MARPSGHAETPADGWGSGWLPPVGGGPGSGTRRPRAGFTPFLWIPRSGGHMYLTESASALLDVVAAGAGVAEEGEPCA